MSFKNGSLSTLLARINSSAVGWSWIFNGLRLASGILLLPLVLRFLPETELGMYYVLLSLLSLVPLVDFGFAPTVGRHVSYAMGGAKSIQAHGITPMQTGGEPNYKLLWELLHTVRALYRVLSLVLLVILAAWGTYVVELRVHDTPSPTATRIAWAVTLAAALSEIYSYWWATYLRSMNQVLSATRITVAGLLVKLGIAVVLLFAGAGLLSLPLGTFMGSLTQRFFAKRRCLEILSPHEQPPKVNVRNNLKILWPNTWRLGMQFLSGYLTVNANTAICLHVLGLTANAQYGLSVQLVGIATGMAMVWISVKWPLIAQLRARNALREVQQVLYTRIWLQNLTFVVLCLCLIAAGPTLIRTFGAGKEILPRIWLGLLMLNAFLELQFTVWGTLISTENRLPYLWPTVATNVLSLTLSLALILTTDLGLGALVLGPLCAGIIFNYWFWPAYGARGLGTTWFRLTFSTPKQVSGEPRDKAGTPAQLA